MREITISATELQAFVGDALRAKLAAHGFSMGTPSDRPRERYLLPVDLNLTGITAVICGTDGSVTIQQEDEIIGRRLFDASAMHVQAVQDMWSKLN